MESILSFVVLAVFYAIIIPYMIVLFINVFAGVYSKSKVYGSVKTIFFAPIKEPTSKRLFRIMQKYMFGLSLIAIIIIFIFNK